MDILTLLTSLNGVAAVVHIVLNILLTELTKNNIKIANGWKQALSWVVSIAVGFMYNVMDIGIFAGLQWYIVLIYGFLLGLISNGVFDIKQIQIILESMSKNNTKVVQ